MNHFVKEFYDSNAEAEWQRLDSPLSRIEFVSTLRLIEKYFPKQGHICDIGGGPGRYTIELIRRGFAVTLIDISDEEIRLAGTELDDLKLTAEQLIVGDAQDLKAFVSGSFDAALSLGPMYHIVEPENRLGALRELVRILKPDGVAIIAYLNSWGLIKTGIVDFPNQFRDIAKLRAMLGERTFAGQSLTGFTECYWSTPEDAFREINEVGLEIISYAGVESFASGMGSLLEQLETENSEAYENVVEVAAETCELAQYRDSTDHLHVVVRKKALA